MIFPCKTVVELPGLYRRRRGTASDPRHCKFCTTIARQIVAAVGTRVLEPFPKLRRFHEYEPFLKQMSRFRSFLGA
jgi:hypothetical protein